MYRVNLDFENGKLLFKNGDSNFTIFSKLNEFKLKLNYDDSAWKRKINSDGVVFYFVDAIYEENIFNIVFKFEGEILNSIKFQLFDRINQDFDPYDYEKNLGYLYQIVQNSDYLKFTEDEFGRGRSYEYIWGSIVVYYEIKSLNCSFTLRFKK